ncbi:MAG: lysine--tRNA ligase, partial [Chloroflexota bacterium]|nr:lysine--tRNA ligase [Chloroflexota bacterium]
AEKGDSLTEAEVAILEERSRAARAWLDSYAPDQARIEVRREALPPAATDLEPQQRVALASLAEALDKATAWEGESLQAAIFDAARAADLSPGRVFAAIYLAFLGQASGPRAGWLLASLEPAFVVERLRAAAAPDTLSS